MSELIIEGGEMVDALPVTVRYVKNGEGGRWWSPAKGLNQVHLGWRSVPHDLLRTVDFAAIKSIIQDEYGPKAGATQDFNMLRTLLDHPSRHLWVTFEEGCMWWCTVRDHIHTNDGGDPALGHFWLACNRPWSNRSLGGRHLAAANLPGVITATAGFRSTVCEPRGWREMLRVIHDEQDADAAAADEARRGYELAVSRLVARLRERDFELLIDLVLARSGWVRLAKLGGATEGVDLEVENVATNEIAFVQVKSTAGQDVLDDYARRFAERRDRYQRMIFAVHSPKGSLQTPLGQPVQVWAGDHIAKLVVRLGLGDWVASRL
jgi:hypothetical protein